MLYLVFMNTATPTESRFEAPRDSWLGQLPAPYVEKKLGYRGMRDFVEVHGYFIPKGKEDEFEEGLDEDDRVLEYWTKNITLSKAMRMPFQV